MQTSLPTWHGHPARDLSGTHGQDACATDTRRHGFTALELLTTLALIVIAFGLMVSLARYVRANSADQLTRAVLLDMDQAIEKYHRSAGAYPPTTMPTADVSEDLLAAMLLSGNRSLTDALRAEWVTGDAKTADPILNLLKDGAAVRDAWGRTVGYLPNQHPLIGMAPQNRPFFFSAGPDGRYLTRQDNLYSYEQPRRDGPSPRLPATGQREQ